MAPALMTYSQLRAALLERYQRPPERVSTDRLEDHLVERVFRPLEALLLRTGRLDQIITRLVTDTALPAVDRAQLVGEFQDTLELILTDYQVTLLAVPNETVVAAAKAAQ
jgi:hypothetical protein